MKKYILISIMFLALAFTGTLKAQDRALEMGYNDYRGIYTTTAADTIGTGDSIYIFQVHKLIDEAMVMVAYFDIDSVGGAASTTIVSSWKTLPNQSYTTGSTVTWSMTGDTTFTMTETAKNAAYYRWTITGSASTVRALVSKLEIQYLKN
jgi:hypothetical protein